MKLDLGCGKNKREGFIGVDVRAFDGVDQVIDLSAPWPWEDNSVDEVNCSHMVEHLKAEERIHFVNELFRVMKQSAKCTIIVPHWASCRAYGDLTHCFAEDTEILSECGWKPITAIAIGERVLTMDLETEATRLTPVLR